MQIWDESKTETRSSHSDQLPLQIRKVGDTQVCEATEKKLLAEETPVPVLPVERLEAVETADQEWEEHHVVAEEVD